MSKQHRPIFLLNVTFKIIIRVLMCRLSRVAEGVVHLTQTAFIPGRHIFEGVVVLSEVFHELKWTNAQGIILKLHLEKAHNKVQ